MSKEKLFADLYFTQAFQELSLSIWITLLLVEKFKERNKGLAYRFGD